MSETPTQTFFVTDVETTGVDPVKDVVLSLGCVVVTYDGECATIDPNYFYESIDQTSWMQTTQWLETITDPASTLSWWLRLPSDVQEAAWRSKRDRFSEKYVAGLFAEFVDSMSAGLPDKPVFAASPASFDWPFVDQMLRNAYERNPFDYRTLCVRSLSHGVRKGAAWGANGWQHRSQAPHHALYDAYAAALDLQMLLSERDEANLHDQLLLTY